MLNSYKLENIDNIWFTSDTHFGHDNIIKYANRPFKTVEEMDKELIKRWNDVVKENDIVYHLGDFTLGNIEQFIKYYEQLNGKIYILENKWHHDKRWIEGMYSEPYFIFDAKSRNLKMLQPIEVLKVEDGSQYGKSITLCHYPLEHWESSHYAAIHLHGHIHTVGNLTHTYNKLDVGVDNANFAPVSLRQVMELLY